MSAGSLPFTDAAAASRRGSAHEGNDDASTLLDARLPAVATARHGCLFAVCDGVSSVPSGGWAARTACERLAGFFEPESSGTLDGLLQGLNEIDWELRGKGVGMAACTLTAVWIARGVASVLRVGDSRVFRIRDGAIHEICPGGHRGRSLQAYLGMGPGLNQVLRTWQDPVRTGDVFLLTTDGLLSIAAPLDLAAAWWSAGMRPRACCEQAVALAEARGATDDATLVVVDVLADETPPHLLPATRAQDAPRT
ncbi:MAG: protein phosphatase 2C domain-containing protein [Deltaproteobacteria bacterium]|nr:protein phosphatase 2C domain-containing protein [Deltaproteobacteria bacterium]